ncbi:MAG TPA: hypothetical protein VEX86_26645 [Longimicrobium sp.]|nr:hypothetical protein [Longimicrobium sp.]
MERRIEGMRSLLDGTEPGEDLFQLAGRQREWMRARLAGARPPVRERAARGRLRPQEELRIGDAGVEDDHGFLVPADGDVREETMYNSYAMIVYGEED